MCNKCCDISCLGCEEQSSVTEYSSELKYNGDKFVCNVGWNIYPNQNLNKVIHDLAKVLCDAANYPQFTEGFAIKELPDGWDLFTDISYPQYLNNWYIILQFTNGVASSVIVDSAIPERPFAVDRNNCKEEVSVDFVNMEPGFTNGGGDGKITLPFSTWEFDSDRRTLEFDGTTAVGVYQFDLELSTASCGTVTIPYILVVNP
jgi:hypothetical protein